LQQEILSVHAVLSSFAKKFVKKFDVDPCFFCLRGEILLRREIAKTLKILRQLSGGGHFGGVPGRPAAADPGADLSSGGGTRR
jgi:hypothetical protein